MDNKPRRRKMSKDYITGWNDAIQASANLIIVANGYHRTVERSLLSGIEVMKRGEK